MRPGTLGKSQKTVGLREMRNSMNRIDALEAEANEFTINLITERFAGIGQYHQAFSKQFAELIIRECAQVCRDQPNIYAMKADRDNCALAILEHFGVEG